MLQEARCGDQEEGDGKRAHNPGQLRPRSRRFGYGSARRTAADGKTLKEAGGQIGGAEADHFLIRIDMLMGARRIGAREHTRIGE